MNDLRDPLDDLLAEIPSYVVPDARAAWAAGARRRTRHRVGVVAAVVLVVGLLAGAVTWLPHTVEPQPADSDDLGVGGYPARVLKPWISRDLPPAPGPMAMVYVRTDSWWVADAEGHTWRVPQEGDASVYPPALSADGRMLGYLADDATYLVRDLVSGEQTVFDSIRGGSGEQSEEGSDLAPHLPGFWSPDGTRLVLPVAMYEPRTDDNMVVLDVDGSVTSLRALGSPAGWVDADTFAVIENQSAYDGKAPAELRLIGLDGTVERKARLEVGRDRAAFLGPYSVDPEAVRLAALDDDGRITVFSLLDGSRISQTPGDAHAGCAPSWQGSEPVVFPATLGRSLVTASGETVVEFDERLGAGCGMAASQALAGSRHIGVAQRWFGDGWLSWHAREVALGVVAGGLGLVLLLVLGRRRLGRRATAP